MSERDNALFFKCDEAACHQNAMFYEIFTMDYRLSIIRAILDAAVQSGELTRTNDPQSAPVSLGSHNSGESETVVTLSSAGADTTARKMRRLARLILTSAYRKDEA